MNVTPLAARLPAPHFVAFVPAPLAEVPLPLAPQRSALAQALAGLAPPRSAPPCEPQAIGCVRPEALVGAILGEHRILPTLQVAANAAINAAVSLELPATLPRDASLPELSLLRDPRAFVAQPNAWKDLLAAHLHPAWLEAALRQEKVTPDTETNALHAQENRLRALARYLICLRAARASCAVARELSALLPHLLALPSVESRHRLLMLLAVKGGDPERRAALLQAWNATEASDAKPLALAMAIMYPDLSAKPAVRALLESRAVLGHGVVARRVLAYILRGTSPDGFDVDRRVMAWATDANLLRLLQLGIGRSKTVATAGRLLNAQGACPDRAAKGPWMDARAADAQHNQVLMALLADRHERHAASHLDAALLRLEVERLQGAFRWLASQNDLATVGKVGQDLCAPLRAEDTSAKTAASQRDDTLKALARLRTTARTGKKTPRSEWVQELITQLENSVRAWAARRADGDGGGDGRNGGNAQTSPQATFFAHKASRTYMNQVIAPVVLALQQHTPLLNALARHGRAVDINAVTTPEEVMARCVPWFKNQDAALLDRFLNEVKAPEQVVAYAARSSTWSADYRARGLPMLERLVRATLDGSYAELRGQAPQMQALRAQPCNHAALARWEAGSSQKIPACLGNGEWHVYDTADLGDTFDAMAQIASCQSPTDGWESHNVGNLGRLMDGSKRIIVLRDAQGKVRGRSIVRLMQGPDGEPVLTLSTLFVATLAHQSHKAREALAAYAARRAAELGIEAVYASYGQLGEESHGPSYSKRLTSACAALPDYYDELGGLLRKDAVFEANRAMWSLRNLPLKGHTA